MTASTTTATGRHDLFSHIHEALRLGLFELRDLDDLLDDLAERCEMILSKPGPTEGLPLHRHMARPSVTPSLGGSLAGGTDR